MQYKTLSKICIIALLYAMILSIVPISVLFPSQFYLAVCSAFAHGALLFGGWMLSSALINSKLGTSGLNFLGKLWDKSAVIGKTVAMNALPYRLFIKLSQKFPIGSWQIYFYPPGKDEDNLHYAILSRDFESFKEFVDTLPQETLETMLARESVEHNNGLYNCTLIKKERSIRCFEYLLSKISPECTFNLLKQESGLLDFRAPVIFHVNLSEKRGFWKAIVAKLSTQQVKALLDITDKNNDTLLVAKAKKGAKQILPLLKIYKNKDTQKDLLLKMCPHGLNPLMHLFIHNKACYAKELFSLSDDIELWNELFSHKPKNWRMSLGEKLLVFFYAFERKEDIQYFERELKLRLPEMYAELSEKQRTQRLNSIKQNYWASDCEILENFKTQQGQYPFELLDIEPISESKQITKQYKRFTRKMHPDKNGGNNQEQTAKINEACRFMTDPDVCDKYASPVSAQTEEILASIGIRRSK